MNRIRISSGLLTTLFILICTFESHAQKKDNPNMAKGQIISEEVLYADYIKMPPYKQKEIDDHPKMFKVVDRLHENGKNSENDDLKEVVMPEEILHDEYNSMSAAKKKEIDDHPNLFKIVNTRSEQGKSKIDQPISREEIPHKEYIAMPADKRQEIDNHPDLFEVVSKPSNAPKVGAEKQ